MFGPLREIVRGADELTKPETRFRAIEAVSHHLWRAQFEDADQCTAAVQSVEAAVKASVASPTPGRKSPFYRKTGAPVVVVANDGQVESLDNDDDLTQTPTAVRTEPDNRTYRSEEPDNRTSARLWNLAEEFMDADPIPSNDPPPDPHQALYHQQIRAALKKSMQ